MCGKEVRLTGCSVRVWQTRVGVSRLKVLLDPHLARAHAGAMQARVCALQVWREQYKVRRLAFQAHTSREANEQ